MANYLLANQGVQITTGEKIAIVIDSNLKILLSDRTEIT